MDILSWEGFGTARLWVSLAVIGAVLLPYVILVVIDFKYKEMEYWKILIASSINIVVFHIACSVLVDWTIGIIHFLIVAIVFLSLSYLNGVINKEKVVGQADVDVFISQALLSISFLMILRDYFEPGTPYFLNMIYFVQTVMSSIFIGLLITVAIWIIVIIIQKFRRGIGIKDAVIENRNVPTLIAFLGWITVNMFVILGF